VNKISRSIIVLFVFASLILGACAGAASSAVGGGKPEASTTAYTGTIESITGSQWVVNGQVITVDATVVHDGPFNVGDVIKVEVVANADGTFTVTRVEVPTQEDLAQLPGSVDDNSNDASDDIDDDINDDHGGDVNGNDDSSNSSGVSNGNGGNSDGSLETVGVLQEITASSITVDGVTYTLVTGAEVKGPIQVGDTVKIHFQPNPDGTFSVREVTPFDPNSAGSDDNGNDDSSDDNGVDDNSNDATDDNSNSNSNSNSDDNGGGNGGGNSGSGHGGGG